MAFPTPKDWKTPLKQTENPATAAASTPTPSSPPPTPTRPPLPRSRTNASFFSLSWYFAEKEDSNERGYVSFPRLKTHWRGQSVSREAMTKFIKKEGLDGSTSTERTSRPSTAKLGNEMYFENGTGRKMFFEQSTGEVLVVSMRGSVESGGARHSSGDVRDGVELRRYSAEEGYQSAMAESSLSGTLD